MAVPLASQLTADASGSRLAWVVDTAGRRSIHVAQAPQWSVQEVAAFDDDGMPLADLTWAHDGGAVYFSRGVDQARVNSAPLNAALDALPSERGIWRAGVVPQQRPKWLFDGYRPVAAPNGQFAFLRDGDLYLAAADGSNPRRVLRDQGEVRQPKWSPDGLRIAFVSSRGAHALIGVYDIELRQLSYLDPSVDTDSDPVWSADGRRIAFLRSPVANDYRRAHRAGEPFSLRIADVTSGEGRELWRADRGDGSIFSRIEIGDQITWCGDTLIFPWEKDGWRRLYALPVSGGMPRALTPSGGEVDGVSVSARGERVLYSSNHVHPERRNLWLVSTRAARSPRRMDTDAVNSFSPTLLAGSQAIAYLATDAYRPARVMVRGEHGDAGELAAVPLAQQRAAHMVEPIAVSFDAMDGARVHGQLFVPVQRKPYARRAAVVFLHGGPKDQMLLGYHSEPYYAHAYSFIQALVSQGVIALTVNFRGGTGYGLHFREVPDASSLGASDMHDVIGAALYLRDRSDVDPGRIGVFGGSYGGMLTQLALARASELFAVGVSIHGVFDMREQSRAHNPLSVLMPAFDPTERALRENQLLYESTAVAAVKRWRSPVLLVHGDDDRSVPFVNMVRTVAALREHDVEFEQLVLPNEAHAFLLHRSWLKTYRTAADFFRRRLLP